MEEFGDEDEVEGSIDEDDFALELAVRTRTRVPIRADDSDAECEDVARSAYAASVPSSVSSPSIVVQNFIWMSILVSALPATALACLALATAELGALGAWQSGALYCSYTISSVTVATYVVKIMGARDGLWIGMVLFCLYVTCFVVALTVETDASRNLWALLGASLGGIGAGILWTAQGTYLALAATEYAITTATNATTTTTTTTRDKATGYLAGIFAFIFLAEETVLDVLSTVLTDNGFSWRLVFATYGAIAVASTCTMPWVVADYRPPPITDAAEDITTGTCTKITAAVQLLRSDPKMKYMVGFNAAFGFTGAFLNSFVNGQVVPVVMGSADDVGLLVAVHGCTAALCSLFLGYAVGWGIDKSSILYAGALSFAGVALPFLFQPDLQSWTRHAVVALYMAEGLGRATFEGTFKALFADYFGDEPHGAYANIILQNGSATAVAYVLSVRLGCRRDAPDDSRYCVQYQDGSHHDLLTFCMIIVATAGTAICGLSTAARLHRNHQSAPYGAVQQRQTNNHADEMNDNGIERNLPGVT